MRFTFLYWLLIAQEVDLKSSKRIRFTIQGTEKMNADEYRQKQMDDAEELLGDRLEGVGFAKALFFGKHLRARLTPYPKRKANAEVNDLVARLQKFCEEKIDPNAIDNDARIPDSVIEGLGKLGVLGACLPKDIGGLGLSQSAYCQLLEVLGHHCASTALFVNAHHSIGPRALVLFGTEEQQKQWLPKMVTGECISAFALTEPEAGSDAGNVQTMATPSPDGKGYLLNGEKRWITNGGIAESLIVMARTPVEGSTETKISAFQVSSKTKGFEVVEERMEKMGVRGTATSRLAFHDMYVAKEDIIGEVGRGLKVALTVLDYGRTTFGATCTGAAKFCIERSKEHVLTRVQFQQPLAAFELVKEKIAHMFAGVYAMEAMTYQTASLIDSGDDDYMLETAMLKIFATETLNKILDDTFQLHGGKAFFLDEPFHRMVRDAKINTIGEGANDVLRVFVALGGMRGVGKSLEELLEAAKNPLKNLGQLGSFAGERLERIFAFPTVTVNATQLEPEAKRIAKLLGRFSNNVEKLLVKYREEILDRQCKLAPIGDTAIDLYACGCVLARLDSTLTDHHVDPTVAQNELEAGRHFIRLAEQRIEERFRQLQQDDEPTMQYADRVLKQ